MDSDILRHLNIKQKESVINYSGPAVILAGAGSGKTRVLVAKVIYLIKEKNINPLSIVMMTFTNKAAAEMKERINRQLGGLINLGFVGTYHSFCVRVLRRFWESAGLDKNFIIYDDDDQKSLIKQIISERKLEKKSPGYFLYYISLAKNQLITPESFLENFKFHQAALVADVYFHYQKKLEKNKGVDFDDLLLKTVNLFKKNKHLLDYYQKKYQYFLVDEFQDTNHVQYLLTKFLAEKSKNITVVGDFSQSIYSWRGADITNLEKFEKDFKGTKTFYLEENYRSTQKILDFAYSVISKNSTHPILHLFTDNKPGEEVVFYQADNEQAEAIFIAEEVVRLNNGRKIELPTFAILYRTNAQSRVLEEVFLHYGIPYILVGGTRFYERKEIKDVLAYLKLLINPNESVSLERIKKLGKNRFEKFKKLYEETKDKLETYSTNEIIEKLFQSVDYLKLYNVEDEEDFSRLENIKELKSVALSFPKLMDFLEQVALVESEYSEHEKKTRDDSRQLVLMTLHQAKGLEFDHVFIVGVEEGLLPHSRSIDDQFQLEEERRLFYVGITRAKKSLYITNTRKRFIFGSQGYSTPSRFIADEQTSY
ncbi:MAG: UvrD-helicase domain-containing protein [Candidatus Roizmanbacteria bacterium]|nr:UvrD-helicase domain-containing protein [Candidatus Roizmanbacteria bacterium]